MGLGIAASLRPGSLLDVGTMGGALVGVSVPVFCLGYVLIVLLGEHVPYAGRIDEELRAGFAPTTGFYLLEALVRGEWAALKSVAAHLLLPSLALSTVPLAVVARITRSSMLEVLSQDYVRTAKAKGLRYRRVVGLHVLRNSLIPAVTATAPLLGLIITGTFVIEFIFSIPGIGRYFINSVSNRDYSVVMGITVLTSVIIVIANLFVDIMYGVLDPRTREAR